MNVLLLTKETLAKHYMPLPSGRKIYRTTREAYVNFSNGIATLSVKLTNEPQRSMYLHVEYKELHVACDCGMPGGKLCHHAFFCLYNLVWLRSRMDLKPFYWPGITSDLKRQQKFLRTVIDTNGYISVSLEKEYGNIYRPGLGFAGAGELSFEPQQHLSQQPRKATSK
jgi:hypothetical protein